MSFIMLSHSRFPRQDIGEIASAEKVFFFIITLFFLKVQNYEIEFKGFKNEAILEGQV